MRKYLLHCIAVVTLAACGNQPTPAAPNPSPHTQVEAFMAPSDTWLYITNKLPPHIAPDGTRTDVVIDHVKFCAAKAYSLEPERVINRSKLENCAEFKYTIGHDSTQELKIENAMLKQIEAKRFDGSKRGEYELFIGTGDQDLKHVVWPCKGDAGHVYIADIESKSTFKWEITKPNKKDFTCIHVN